MIQIPANLVTTYTTFLQQSGVPSGQHRYYIKWLRYYFDFCSKYNFRHEGKESFAAFVEKLKEKKQGENLRKQAHHAVSLFYEMEQYSEGKIQNDIPLVKNTVSEQTSIDTTYFHTKDYPSNQAVYANHAHNVGKTAVQGSDPQSRTGKAFKQSGADWTEIFNELKNVITMRHYSPKTLKTYSGWTRKFQAYTKSKEPRLVSIDDVKNFLTWLAVDQGVSASSQNQAFNALLFLFRNVFGKEFGKIDGIVRAKRRPYIPVVLSRCEVDRIIGFMKYPHKLIISLMYGGGLRISECLSLRVQNFNFDMKILTIHDGKGQKDRTVPIPEVLMGELKAQLDLVIEQHEKDCQAGFDGVFLYGQLEKKYKNAARELVWQWFFPAKELTLVPKNKKRRRYHVHETSLQKALRKAVKKAKIPKRVTSHTFRHSFASHLLQANYDIRTIQELLGHSDVRTTMIYTHTVKSVTIKETKSPLDF